MIKSRRLQIIAAAVACTTIGAAAGIAGSDAASTKGNARSSHADRAKPPGGFHGPPVHAEEVVLNKAGDGYVTVTEDNGTVESVSGDQLTVKEAVKSVAYKTVTLTIPSDATVMRNFAKAQLSDLKSGDRVHVSQSSEGTTVLADDGSVKPPHGPGGRGGHGPPPGRF